MTFTIDSEVIPINPSLISKLAKRKAENGTGARFSHVDTDNDGSVDGRVSSLSKKDEKVVHDPKMPSRCWLCKASRLRVVSVGNTGRRILECANRNCLATIEYTDLPVGTIIEQEKATKKNYGWYLRDTSEMIYPPKERIDAFPNPPFEYVPETLYDSGRRIVIRCPGQRKLVYLQ
ncbi:unnamed protein product [Heligmosomoides polygyrus]|uniref:PARP-type domain-containing protein n=1 Tax=Heligmosomoides polygyrus TaxID=6339 RepID=A0A183G070_HELPZ|nr:unnamed protein product [Heligmosomoides polygyrus]